MQIIMKKSILLVLLSMYSTTSLFAQIFIQETSDKSIEITPRGIKGAGTASVSTTTLLLGPGIPTDIFQSNNTVVGAQAAGLGGDFLQSTVFGYRAFYNSFISNGGSMLDNIAVGSQAMLNYLASHNLAVGFEALRGGNTPLNNTGRRNTAVGYSALSQNSSGENNTALGAFSLLSNTMGRDNVAIGAYSLISNTIGNNNVAIGTGALYRNTTGSENVAVGKNALYHNIGGLRNTAVGFENQYFTIGSDNTAIGVQALRGSTVTTDNTGGGNTAIGDNALLNNTSGNRNIAIGFGALLVNTSGAYNIALGNGLSLNTTGAYNIAAGNGALFSNRANMGSTAIGSSAMIFADNRTADARYTYNTAVGYEALRGSATTANNTGRYNSAGGVQALRLVSSGNYNTAVGALAGNTISTGNNNTAIGYDAQVPSGTTDNQIRIGNSAVTFACVQVAWTVTSDRRWKEQIQPLNLGNDFIGQLRPVSYHRKNNANAEVETGLIAQDLAVTLRHLNAPSLGVLQKNTQGFYSVRYTDLLMPLIKALQEQQGQIDEWKAVNVQAKQTNTQLGAENEAVAAKISRIKVILEAIENSQK
jgi:hypothetical protein